MVLDGNILLQLNYLICAYLYFCKNGHGGPKPNVGIGYKFGGKLFSIIVDFKYTVLYTYLNVI